MYSIESTGFFRTVSENFLLGIDTLE